MLVPLFTTSNEAKMRLLILDEKLKNAEQNYEVALSTDIEFKCLKRLYTQIQELQLKRELYFDLAAKHTRLNN